MADLPEKPINRKEKYLNAIAMGDPSGLPDPITREEAYLAFIAENGGGGGGAGGEVKGVKGNAEPTYRKGNVNLTPANLGIEKATASKLGLVMPDNETIEIDTAGKISVKGGAGGDAALESDVISNLEVGAIPSGTTISEGTTFTEFVQKLLITEIAPTIAFSASGSGVREVGSSVTPTYTLNITDKGTGTPVSVDFYRGSTKVSSQPYSAGTNSYSYTDAAITDTITVRGVLNYTKSDSVAAAVDKTVAYTFVMASYYGAVSVAPTTKAEIIGLTKNVKSGKGQTATFNLSNQRSCYAYPASFGDLASIKDANNFEYLSSYTKTSVTVDGTAYNVYTLSDPVTASGFKQIYS